MCALHEASTHAFVSTILKRPMKLDVRKNVVKEKVSWALERKQQVLEVMNIDYMTHWDNYML